MNTFASIRLRALCIAFAAALFWAFAAAAAAAAPGAGGPAVLKSAVTVDDGVVRLGDLFDNAGPHAQRAVAYSPKPGKQSVFGVRWLVKAAKHYRLEWEPETHEDRVVVTRSATVIPAEAFAAAVRRALSDYGIEGDITVELDNPLLRLEIPGRAEPSARIENLRYEPANGRFMAVAAAPADDPAARRLRISGRAFRMVEIPAPVKNIARGDVITERDITWIEVKAGRIQRDVITEAGDLIGMAAARSLREGLPVRKAGVHKPILVKRGSLVTIRLRHGGMSLTARGRALDNGALGDVIQVSNSQSSQVIEAEVDSAGGVVVRIGALAMN